MVKRNRITLIYSYNEGWIGGTYYVENLIKALSQLPDVEQPEIFICCSSQDDETRLSENINYPYITFRRFEKKLSFAERLINRVTYMLFRKRFISPLYNDTQVVFPVLGSHNEKFRRITNLYWIPDFQEHHLPHFFSTEEVKYREINQKNILQIRHNVIFSSYAVQNDFKLFYPNNEVNNFVLPFAVSNSIDINLSKDVLDKHSISRPYFICSNQFWKHKNHHIVLRAIAEVRNKYPSILLVFTGKEHDYRNPNYFEELESLRLELNLSSEIRFLGFISRLDQLLLMKNSTAVIQPSLFEGWSTVVEDAKSLNVPVIASNIGVHLEQLDNYNSKLYFNPHNSFSLSNCLVQALNGEMPAANYDYSQNIQMFARNFLSIIAEISKK